MRIALVIPGGAGGGARSVVRLAGGLADRGHDVLLLHRDAPRPLREKVRALYLAMRYGRHGGNWLHGFRGRARPYRQLAAETVGRHDVVVGVGVDCALEVADLPDECGIKVHNSRGVEPWIAERMRRAWALPMARIVNGGHLKDLMRRQGCREAIHVAHNGVDRRDYFPSVASPERDGVGTVYHGGSVKDPALILNVLQRLRDARPDLPLYVFSTFPRPRSLPSGTRYVRFPSLPAARNLYSRSLVWFMASRNEGLPNPVLEAMACGCGVVSTDCGGPGDIIQSGRNGFLTPVGEAAAMTARILELLDDETLRCRFARACETTLDHFTWANAIDSFEAALKAIVATPAPPAGGAADAASHAASCKGTS